MESGHGMLDHPGSYQASRRRRMSVPALPPYLIEPIWQQLEALLPEREVSHPLGCHRPRIPERVVFEKLVQVLVFGCAYWRIADEECSATTLRRRRDEWIKMGLMDALEGIALTAYDRIIGLELADVCVDWVHHQSSVWLREVGQEPGGPRQAGHQTLDDGGCEGYPSRGGHGRGQPPRLAAPGSHSRRRSGGGSRVARARQRSPRPRLRLEDHQRASGREGLGGRDSQEGLACFAHGRLALGGGTNQLVAQRPQEAGVVHREGGSGHRLLARVLQRDHHSAQADPGSLETL